MRLFPNAPFDVFFRNGDRRATAEFDKLAHWVIKSPQRGSEEPDYELRVRRYNDDDTGEINHYKFFISDYSLGDPIELVTPEEFERRKQDYLENEGSLEECPWLKDGKVRFMKSWEESIMKHLIRRWEAVCELVSPGYTL